MSGLDKIIEAIAKDAKMKADGILGEAAERIDGIYARGQEEQEILKRQFREKDRHARDEILRRAESTDRQQRKQELLRVRSEMIEAVLRQAKQQIIDLADGEYFDLLYHVFLKNARKAEGKLLIAQNDLSRMPKGFAERCSAAVQEGGVVFGGGTSAIPNGFLIVYGKIEQNCSIDSIFEVNKNLYWDRVNVCLTEEQGA